MRANSIPGDVYYGAYVPAGKVIGAVGTTGYSSGYHLHYQISWAMWSNPINPMGESYIYSTIQKPSAPNVRISKDVLKTGEKATLSWDACNGATYYWVSCWSTTEQCISEAATGFSKEVSFSKPGRYSITVVSGNSEGETIGNWVDIEVFSKDGYLFIEYDNNDGTPDARLARVEYDTYYKIQKCFSQRACHKFIGWTAQRESDKKWHVDGHSWRTEAEIRDNNWDKTIYPANVAYKFDQSWYKGGKDGDTITFYAVWEEDHELKSTVIQEGSCTEAKIIDYACDCGQTGYRYTGTAKGHWSSGLITDDNGRIYRRCTVCGEILGYEFDFSVGIDLEKVFLLTQISNTSGGLELSWFAGG